MTEDREGAAIAAFAAAMCEPDAPARIRDDLPTYLAEHGVDPADREILTRHRDQLLVYRAMVHSRLRGVISEYLPRTVAILGKPRLHRELSAFMAEQAPRSVYFRCVPGEFLAWAAPRWRLDDALPDHLVDLASHELLDQEVHDSVAGGEAASGLPLALDRPVQLDGSVRLRRYAFAVHRNDDPPTREPTALLAYRDRDSLRMRLLELTPRAAALCSHLFAGACLQTALTDTCTDCGEVMSDEFLAAMASFLADLGDRGVLLGAADSCPPG
ncbi:MAG: putative DNA-binding domain-containing protein [Nannocystis sp.]|uniref:HvfC family peptide modification chaperone n=1 Tax=Nannocystis sp. TaxID=1962667 RepID=UPI0024205187|nr:putative DNA-binding domain-containing protein [Nannocystis sp.]MBK9753356.1 putative DNA-binding domain-containing protein [Nannocystis sp.]